MDCGATSVEPFYNHVVFKKLIGGGSMEIVNPVMEMALYNLGYSEKEIGEILTYLLEKDAKRLFFSMKVWLALPISKPHICQFLIPPTPFHQWVMS